MKNNLIATSQRSSRLGVALSSFALLAIALISLPGCGTAVKSAGEVGKIQGKAIGADGSPLGNVMLVLQPTEMGYVTELEVDSAGEFSGEAIAGKYVYYFAPSKKSKKPLPKTISVAFTEPNMKNLVDVKSGSDIVCQVQ